MPTQKQIEQVAEQFAEARISSLALVGVEVGLAYDVSRATALEVLTFALPRLREVPDE